jgi:SAM-dependent methyltransferase
VPEDASASPKQPWDWTPATLALYDLVVLGISNPFIWRCPTPRILGLYDRHVTGNHVDVGVGTGWYLHRCRFPAGDVRLGLIDLSRDSLDKAARRVRRYRPQLFQASVLEPLRLGVAPFRSMSLTYLLHCLPGDMREKCVAFDHLRPVLEPGGVLFGATLLSGGVPRTGAAIRLMRFYNGLGMFSNERDSLAALRHELESRFAAVEIETIGCAALFSARA